MGACLGDNGNSNYDYREALLSVAKTFFENVDLGEESIKVCK